MAIYGEVNNHQRKKFRNVLMKERVQFRGVPLYSQQGRSDV